MIGKHLKELFYSCTIFLFLVVEFSNTGTFWSNARFEIKLTSIMIIKLDFLCKSICYKSLVGIEISKHDNILSLAHLIGLEVVTSSLTKHHNGI